jgi:hypothetical protein
MIRDHVFRGPAIFMDDTTVALLEKAKGATQAAR